MSDAADSEAPPQQLITYRFPPGVDFGGMLMGALQRIESGGAIRILDALFVARGERPDELVAISLRNDTSAGMIGQLIGFRLDDASRAQETERALNGPAGELIRELAAALGPGCAIAGVLVEHTWAGVLSDTAARIGGEPLASEMLAPSEVPEAWARVPRELARSPG